MAELRNLQKEADRIIEEFDKKHNVEHNLNNTFIHLIEELGEVAHELNKPNIRNEELNKEHLGDELADLLVFIARIANLYNIDLEDAIKNKLKTIELRLRKLEH